MHDDPFGRVFNRERSGPASRDRRFDGLKRGQERLLEFVAPVVEELAQGRDLVGRDGDVAVAEAVDRAHHLGKDMRVEACVERGGLVDQLLSGVAQRQDVDVGEVACCCPVEQGDEFAAGELVGCERGSDEAGGRRASGCRIDGEVDEEIFWTVQDESAEGGGVGVRSTAQPRSRAASSRAPAAAGTLPTPVRVKKSRSWVGRVVRFCASSAAPAGEEEPVRGR